jgi:hypothetical protein
MRSARNLFVATSRMSLPTLKGVLARSRAGLAQEDCGAAANTTTDPDFAESPSSRLRLAGDRKTSSL